MIWDVHTHLPSEGRTPEEQMTTLLRFMDRMGVDRACVMMGTPMVQDPTPEQLRAQNDQVLKAISHHHDRAFGFTYVSTRHPEASVRELDRCVKNGPMVGVKLWVARRCTAPEIDPIITKATELHAPILQHTWYKANGNLPGESTPVDVIDLTKRHPKSPIICGHSGGDWELGFRAVRLSQTLVCETGGFDPTAGCVEMAVRELGADRVLFGSDAAGRSFASQLAKVQGADVPAAAKKKILGENLKELLGPILKAKGMRP
jgi:predicted TIM-barrel fold metal-dependent hydrolase